MKSSYKYLCQMTLLVLFSGCTYSGLDINKFNDSKLDTQAKNECFRKEQIFFIRSVNLEPSILKNYFKSEKNENLKFNKEKGFILQNFDTQHTNDYKYNLNSLEKRLLINLKNVLARKLSISDNKDQTTNTIDVSFENLIITNKNKEYIISYKIKSTISNNENDKTTISIQNYQFSTPYTFMKEKISNEIEKNFTKHLEDVKNMILKNNIPFGRIISAKKGIHNQNKSIIFQTTLTSKVLNEGDDVIVYKIQPYLNTFNNKTLCSKEIIDNFKVTNLIDETNSWIIRSHNNKEIKKGYLVMPSNYSFME